MYPAGGFVGSSSRVQGFTERPKIRISTTVVRGERSETASCPFRASPIGCLASTVPFVDTYHGRYYVTVVAPHEWMNLDPTEFLPRQDDYQPSHQKRPQLRP